MIWRPIGNPEALSQDDPEALEKEVREIFFRFEIFLLVVCSGNKGEQLETFSSSAFYMLLIQAGRDIYSFRVYRNICRGGAFYSSIPTGAQRLYVGFVPFRDTKLFRGIRDSLNVR